MVAGRDVDWDEAMSRGASRPAACRWPRPIRSTSSTPRAPPAGPRASCATTAATRWRCGWSMQNIYDIGPGEVFWAASRHRLGGRPLLHRLRAAAHRLHDDPLRGQAGGHARRRARSGGSSPQHGVKTLFTAPTAFRAIKKEDPDGELAAPPRHLALPRPVPGRRAPRPRHLPLGRRTCWACRSSTTGGRPRPAGRSRPNCIGLEPLPVKPGSPTKPVPGYDVRDPRRRRASRRRRPGGRGGHPAAAAAGTPADALERRRALRRVLPDRHPGYYLTGDGGYFDEDGYLYVMGRIDDVHQRAGHRLSTGAMEEVVAEHPDVAECAVIGVADELKGQVPRRPRGAEGRRRPRPERRAARAGASGARGDRRRSRASAGRGRRAAAQDAHRARSCAGPCGPSPTGGRTRCRRRSTTRRSWMSWERRFSPPRDPAGPDEVRPPPRPGALPAGCARDSRSPAPSRRGEPSTCSGGGEGVGHAGRLAHAPHAALTGGSRPRTRCVSRGFGKNSMVPRGLRGGMIGPPSARGP